MKAESQSKRKTYTLRLCPELKNRVDHWAVERGCRPCDVINDLIADGLIAKERVA